MMIPKIPTANPMGPQKEKRVPDLSDKTAEMVCVLMNAATSFHKLHLKVTGVGSYAAHTALNDLYEALPGHADTIAEGFQGAAMKLLEYEEYPPVVLANVEAGIQYLNELSIAATDLQGMMPYSEIVNDIDSLKSTINSARYKLYFLK